METLTKHLQSLVDARLKKECRLISHQLSTIEAFRLDLLDITSELNITGNKLEIPRIEFVENGSCTKPIGQPIVPKQVGPSLNNNNNTNNTTSTTPTIIRPFPAQQQSLSASVPSQSTTCQNKNPISIKDIKPGFKVLGYDLTKSCWEHKLILHTQIKDNNFFVKFWGDLNNWHSLYKVASDKPSETIFKPGKTVLGLTEHNGLQPGVIGEPPATKNMFRYLVFFDEGESRYLQPKDVYPFFLSDLKTLSRFIRKYLASYPENPKLRCKEGQTIQTKFNGEWLPAYVKEVDASLVKMEFVHSGRVIILYRGSQQLQPLFKSMTTVAQTNRVNFRRHNLVPNVPSQPFIEYTRVEDEPKVKKLKTSQESVTDLTKDEVESDIVPVKEEVSPESISLPKVSIKVDIKTFRYVPHNCSETCLGTNNLDPEIYLGKSVLRTPIHLGWTRKVVVNGNKRYVMYRAPCQRSLPNIKLLYKYLLQTDSKLTIDYFSFKPKVDVCAEFTFEENKVVLGDLSHGIERIPVAAYNDLNDSFPLYMEYINNYKTTKEIPLCLDAEFLCSCDCTDNCEDHTKCQCRILTRQAYQTIKSIPDSQPVGYSYRRLNDTIVTGIYECNSKCKCKNSCLNRVVQNGFKCRVQVFQTEKCGWGMRTLDDIPRGMFITNYVGLILTEDQAEEEGKRYGDEYFAELDHIETVEQYKEGYESGVDSESEETSEADEDSSDLSDEEADKELDANLDKVKDKKTKTSSTKGSSYPSIRSYFQDKGLFIIDAKGCGNVARYINHSCSPNLFVQNVFVNSHDMRFPQTSLFASQCISAGTELTWNYSYVINSVPGKVLHCHCGSSECRGRLL